VPSCKETADEDDPNSTHYLECPGVGGYQLQIRMVGSGRLSVTVVTAAKQQMPLHYDDVVTRSMCSLGVKAEWRVHKVGDQVIPVALIVPVFAHESNDEPEKVTSTYLAVAKVGPTGACVTDRIKQGLKTAAQVQLLADSAGNRSCAAQLSAEQ